MAFDVGNHPKDVVQPGKHALVLDPIMGGCRLSHILMDGGSGLNIIFTNTLEKMRISLSSLWRSDVGFHGVVPGCPIGPWGGSSSRSSSETNITTEARPSSLRLLLFRAATMRSWAGSHM